MSRTEGVKDDATKAPMDLLPWEALEQIALVLAYGSLKYSRANWANGISYSRLAAAILRHVFKFLAGENNDPETGLSHIAHAGAGMLFLLWMIIKRPDMDDRWIKEVSQ